MAILVSHEKMLLAVIAMLIEKDARVDVFEIEMHGPLLNTGEELANLLEDRARFNYDKGCFAKLKDFLGKVMPADYAKNLTTKLLF